jgi:magnesium transporter
LMNIKLNSIISRLTGFTLIIWTMTFLVGIYGMNVPLPGWEHPLMFLVIIGVMLLISVWLFTFFKKRGWFD